MTIIHTLQSCFQCWVLVVLLAGFMHELRGWLISLRNEVNESKEDQRKLVPSHEA